MANLNTYRSVDGAADAASFMSLVSILMQLYPGREALICGAGVAFFGIGTSLGQCVKTMRSLGKLS